MITIAVITFVALLGCYLAATMIPLPGSDCTLADLIDEWMDDDAYADDNEGDKP